MNKDCFDQVTHLLGKFRYRQNGAHLFRKIRAFIDAFPQYRSIMKFYLKLRRIIRNGEKLQAAREVLSEQAFQHRLQALEQRLDALRKWNKPNDTLKEVIKKVHRQKDHILTFTQHDGAHITTTTANTS